MSTRTSIVATLIVGALLIGLRYWVAPETADAGVPLIGGLVASTIAVLLKLDQTGQTSTKNAAAIADVGAALEQANQTTESTHQIVNSQRTAMIAKADAQDRQIAELHASVADLRAALNRERGP